MRKEHIWFRLGIVRQIVRDQQRTLRVTINPNQVGIVLGVVTVVVSIR
jgi:hypothetical protein